MKKRELSKLQRPEATGEMFILAERIEKEKYLATAKIVNVSGERMLLLNFFERSQLMKKKNGAAFRTFLSRDDYITQDLRTTRVKWRTGSFKSILGWYWWNTREKGHDVVFASDKDYRVTKYYMKKYLKDKEANVWEAIDRFQDEVMARKLKERHKKETVKIDQKMELVPPKPEGFERWAHDYAMYDKRYLVYDAGSRKRHISGYCTCCKKTVGIDTKAMKPRNKQRGRCPACNGEVTFIPKGFFPTFQRDEKWVCLTQRVETGIVARYFHAHLEIQKNNKFREEFHVGELCRIFYEENGHSNPQLTSYEWGVYKQHGLPRWCPDMGKWNCAKAVLYTENLPEEWSGTTYQYCAMDLYQKKKGCNAIPVYRYMGNYPNEKFLEYFVKAGLINLVGAVVEGHDYSINHSGKTPVEILGIPNSYIKILTEIDGTVSEYQLLKQCAADHVLPDGNDVHQFCIRFGGNDELMGVINSHMSIGKFVRYMDKQRRLLPVKQEQACCHVGAVYSMHYTKEEKEQMKYKNLAKDWLDYISWCATLNYNMQDMYVLLPPDFNKAHDRVMNEYQEQKDKQERKRQALMAKMIKEALKAAEGMPAMMMKAKGLMIVLPKDGEEIKAEGRILHHCVGTYVERVARGETMILFIRRMEKPEEPYYTLEYKNGKVVQCRGKNNSDMTKEVKAFVKAFEQKMCPAGENKISKKVQKVG